ncbi:hypothetical protein D9758_015818 [Tetrapyrgos nigripes]|uniref:Endonuclease/exonuclease/phosphatase domain-containing protein n=1 Tax=Tetrapyrgos nigripes TaxID=182062 RepID=A0A8H5CGV5_9AGAR|nr:hypothetical protein D9758_015818 [Tetrapyrgos nigripes]
MLLLHEDASEHFPDGASHSDALASTASSVSAPYVPHSVCSSANPSVSSLPARPVSSNVSASGTSASHACSVSPTSPSSCHHCAHSMTGQTSRSFKKAVSDAAGTQNDNAEQAEGNGNGSTSQKGSTSSTNTGNSSNLANYGTSNPFSSSSPAVSPALQQAIRNLQRDVAQLQREHAQRLCIAHHMSSATTRAAHAFMPSLTAAPMCSAPAAPPSTAATPMHAAPVAGSETPALLRRLSPESQHPYWDSYQQCRLRTLLLISRWLLCSILGVDSHPCSDLVFPWGGVATLVRSTLNARVCNDFSGPDLLTVEINSTLFMNTYVLPQCSHLDWHDWMDTDLFDFLCSKIKLTHEQGYPLIVIGDFNAHTGISRASADHPVRISLDSKAPDNHGKCLLECLGTCNTVILNGSEGVPGHHFSFTEHSNTGKNDDGETVYNSSVIDYALASYECCLFITDFSISECTDWSDHSYLTLSLILPGGSGNSHAFSSHHHRPKFNTPLVTHLNHLLDDILHTNPPSLPDQWHKIYGLASLLPSPILMVPAITLFILTLLLVPASFWVMEMSSTALNVLLESNPLSVHNSTPSFSLIGCFSSKCS